jgi:hypothetical protein
MRALVVALAASAVAAAPASAAVFFETPSHNIGCALATSGARCDIRERTWKPPPKPHYCSVDWGFGLAVGRHGFAHWVCAGDTVFGGKKVLAYRKSITRGQFTCTSRRDGMRCVNDRNDHGFKLARSQARWF